MNARETYEQHLANKEAINAFHETLPYARIRTLTKKAEDMYVLHSSTGLSRARIDTTVNPTQEVIDEGLYFIVAIDDHDDLWYDDIFLTWDELNMDDPAEEIRAKREAKNAEKKRQADLAELRRLQGLYPDA